MTYMDKDFGSYQKGEDEIACTYDTAEDFENAMQAWIKSGD